jgi:PKHD-type hydroxylase
MSTKNSYYYFKNVFSNTFCDEVIKYGNSQNELLARTGGLENKELNKKQKKQLFKKRNSNVSWLDQEWIYREIRPYLKIANEQAGWNYHYDYLESVQFTKYKLNQHYGWHTDGFPEPFDINHSNINWRGKLRKISAVIVLSNPSDYKGGELMFKYFQNEKTKIESVKDILPRGSIIVFPSYVLHQVKPVIDGLRYSLVVWALGNPFR